jgi:hypothetical protein
MIFLIFLLQFQISTHHMSFLIFLLQSTQSLLQFNLSPKTQFNFCEFDSKIFIKSLLNFPIKISNSNKHSNIQPNNLSSLQLNFRGMRGSSRVFLGGRCITGPDWHSSLGSAALIALPSILFIAFPYYCLLGYHIHVVKLVRWTLLEWKVTGRVVLQPC